MATTTTTTTSAVKYDLAHTIAPFLDAHLFWDIFSHLENNTNNCYSKEDLLNAKLELVRQTNMVDMEMQIIQQLNCIMYYRNIFQKSKFDVSYNLAQQYIIFQLNLTF